MSAGNAMQVVLIEDEPPALEHLERGVRRWDASVAIAATFDSVAEATCWLSTHPPPDLIISDIQLADGLALEIFAQVGVSCPIIFTTAWDSYVMDALRLGGIDYLLKPITQERLGEALDKYLKLKAHFSPDLGALSQLLGSGARPWRSRIVARQGGTFITLSVADIAWFTSEHKLTFATLTDGKRHLVDGTLAQLETELDPARFFRLNRKYLAQVSAVEAFRPYFKGRVLVILSPEAREEVIVSHQKAGAFRHWLGG